MATSKFVSAKRVTDYANQYHKNQLKIAALRKELRELDQEQEQLGRYLQKQVGTNFQFNGDDDYLKQLTIQTVERFVIDNDQVRKLLKKRTPYKDVSYKVMKVDYVYETKKPRARS